MDSEYITGNSIPKIKNIFKITTDLNRSKTNKTGPTEISLTSLYSFYKNIIFSNKFLGQRYPS